MKNIFILPTDKPSRLFETLRFNFVFDNQNKYSEEYKKLHSYKNKNIYITSDEEIKEGDWFAEDLFKITGELEGPHIEKCIKLNDIWCNDFDVVSTRHKDDCKEIILTTDQDLIKDGVQAINDEFLEWFVKNPNCEYVETEIVEYGFDEVPICIYKIIIPKEEVISDYDVMSNIVYGENVGKKIKIKAKIISKKEPKQETLKEAIDRIAKKDCYDIEGGKVADFVDGMVKGAKWQQERMYSEEDMKLAFEAGYKKGFNGYPNTENWKELSFDEWFNQNKKK